MHNATGDAQAELRDQITLEWQAKTEQETVRLTQQIRDAEQKGGYIIEPVGASTA